MRKSQASARLELPESVWSALVRVYDSGQRLLLDRIELAKLEMIAFARVELVEHATRLVRTLVLALAGGILLVAGWFILSWGLVSLTASRLSRPLQLLIEAGLNLAIGGVLVARASRSRTLPPPSAVDAVAATDRLAANAPAATLQPDLTTEALAP